MNFITEIKISIQLYTKHCCKLLPIQILFISGRTILKPSKIFLTSDGTVLGTAANIEEGIALLFSSYYVFNLEYAAQAQVTLEFFQRYACF